MNPLDNYPRVRKALYFAQWVYNGAATVLGAYFLAQQVAPEDLPRWYVVALAVAPVLWTYLGRTAQTNVIATNTVEVKAPANVAVAVDDTPADDGDPVNAPVVQIPDGVEFQKAELDPSAE